MKWSYGVTTVMSRFDSHLPKTLESLHNAGFEIPVLFVDGPVFLEDYQRLINETKVEVSIRSRNLNVAGNWICALWELYIREPTADRFVIFQDDIECVSNLREYLENSEYPMKGYLNLYTFPANQKHMTSFKKGWYPAPREGLGALGLVFDQNAILKLLSSPHLAKKPQCPNRGWRLIDGGVVEAMKKVGFKEYVHNPSLLQHTGKEETTLVSPVGKPSRKVHPLAPTFPGTGFDANQLLDKKTKRVSRGDRIGLVGMNSEDEISAKNRRLCDLVDIDKWLIKPHLRKRTFPAHESVDSVFCRMGNREKIQDFVMSVDIVLFLEHNYYREIIPLCKEHGVKLVCAVSVPVEERKGWRESVDLFVSSNRPTSESLRKWDLPFVERMLPTTREQGISFAELLKGVK